MKIENMPNLKEQIAFLEMEFKQNKETYIYIKSEFGVKSAELIGEKFNNNAKHLKAILVSLQQLQTIKGIKQ